MNKLPGLFALFLFLLALSSVNAFADELPKYSEELFSHESSEISQKRFSFDNDSFFWIRRYKFLKTSDIFNFSSFNIPGNEIEIKYIQNDTQKWVTTTEYGVMPNTVLYINTDKHHVILGVPAVYEAQQNYDTLKIVNDSKAQVNITSGDGFFNIALFFPQNEKYIAEIWALQSKNEPIEWDEVTESRLLANRLDGGSRLSFEGYYFQTLYNYTPGGEGVYFKHPSNYVGGAFSRYARSNAEHMLGYALMKLSAANQNELGFYPTPCESGWLRDDFGIGAYYYDTRWNSDFLTNLLDAYIVYRDTDFLERAIKYGDFFLTFAEQNHYPAGEGILIQDYWHEEGNKPTHASLNHHLAELNALLKMYIVTEDSRYLALAEKMLIGVEQTVNEWILPDGNLVYALHYTGDTNEMVDYPTLTYNDLFLTSKLIEIVFNKTSPQIQQLMDSKLSWMEKNGVTGFLQRSIPPPIE